MNIPLINGKVDYPKLVEQMWNLLFHRPDPLGFCVIMRKMNWMMKYMSMELEQRRKWRDENPE